MCLFVNDILIFVNNNDRINEIKDILKNNFEIKDMGIANVILGVKLNRSYEGIPITQFHYIEKILKRFGYLECKHESTPYDPMSNWRKIVGKNVS